jgi:enhanced entry protein EnhC
MLATGKGTPTDNSTAHELYLRAAEAGSRTAQFMLGRLYEEGAYDLSDSSSGIEQAAFWYAEAVRQGHRPAEFQLGWLGWRLGVARQDEGRLDDAVRWYEVSAELGFVLGIFRPGKAYALGNGVGRDTEKAKDLLASAAVAGLADAQYELAQLHLNLAFNGADPANGRALLIEAAENGSVEATTLLRSLALKDGLQ